MIDLNHETRIVEANGMPFRTPMVWPGVKAMGGFFPASRDALAQLMPSDRLHPALTPRGQGAVFVEVTQQPLFVITGEDGVVHRQPPLTTCLIGTIVTCDRKPGRLSAISLGKPGSSSALLELAFPVSLGTGEAGGAQVWSEPKFVADFSVEMGDDGNTVTTVSEQGQTVLTLTVPRPGTMKAYETDVALFCAGPERLIGFSYRSRGWRSMALRGSKATLALGNHPVSWPLADLGMQNEAFVTFVMHNEVDLQFAPTDFGAVARPLPVYTGVTRTHGEWRYAASSLGPIDMYAGVPDSMFEEGAAA